MALHRPSELARMWELHPKTVVLWIREGKLPAIRTPGAQYRIRTDDARAYCQKNGLPMPRAIAAPAGTVAAVGKASAATRAIGKLCAAEGAAFTTYPTALEGLVAVAADPPDVLAVDARTEDVKLDAFVRAFARGAKTADTAIIVVEAATKSPSLLRLGASAVALRGDPDEAARVTLDLLKARRRGAFRP